VPDTLTIQERLPPGIAAVLINRAHSHTDICLPLGARELRWLEAIDGKSKIGTLPADEAERDALRSFFERLWWHDQVVFDAAPQS
jgi:hypothetical protein